MKNIKTFVFLDLETTGLPWLENNQTKITELSLVAVKTEHLSSGSLPRVANKLCLCFNPQKSISSKSKEITGLSNQLLEHLPPFSSATVPLINSFLKCNEEPLCFVAHNGDRFDYPILKAEIHKSGVNLLEDIFCIDSLKTFRELHEKETVPESNEILQPTTNAQTNDSYCVPPKKIKTMAVKRQKKVSFSLGEVYKRLTKGKKVINAHSADGDVQMLLMCASTLGDKFVAWAEENARKFSDIPSIV